LGNGRAELSAGYNEGTTRGLIILVTNSSSVSERQAKVLQKSPATGKKTVEKRGHVPPPDTTDGRGEGITKEDPGKKNKTRRFQNKKKKASNGPSVVSGGRKKKCPRDVTPYTAPANGGRVTGGGRRKRG